jgi:transcription elongation factor GreA
MRAPMTTVGAKRLREELEHLKSVKRPEEIIAASPKRVRTAI